MFVVLTSAQCLVEIALVLDQSLKVLECGTEYVQWANMFRAKLLVPPPLDGAESAICSSNLSYTGMFLALHDKYFDKKAEWRVKLEDGSTVMDDWHYRKVYNRGTMRKSRRLSKKNLNLQELPSVYNDGSVGYVAADIKASRHLTVTKSDATHIHNIKDIVDVLYNVSNTISKRLQQEYSKMAETKVTEWTCSYCRCENKVIHCDSRRQVPFTKCRCCGSGKEQEQSLQTTSAPFRNHIDLNTRIETEWNALMEEIEQNPKGHQCGQYIDSCPMIQKFFLMMKYYHIHIGKGVVDLDDAKEYQVDNMSDLVENLQGLSLTKMVDMFEHISTVHRNSTLFDHFIKAIGKCEDGAECDILLRNRRRIRPERSEEILDAVEQQTLSLFAKWHSFFFHPQFKDNGPGPSSLDDQQFLMRSFSGKYVDYRFGVWIDYTAHSPSFESMKQEMMENEVYSMTSNQWQSTLMQALTHLDSGKLQVDQRYTAKLTDKRYGIESGQKIGIENIVAILIYCNYTELQARFSETFRRVQDDDTEEMIAERHCNNYYWLGRCVCSPPPKGHSPLHHDVIFLDRCTLQSIFTERK